MYKYKNILIVSLFREWNNIYKYYKYYFFFICNICDFVRILEISSILYDLVVCICGRYYRLFEENGE